MGCPRWTTQARRVGLTLLQRAQKAATMAAGTPQSTLRQVYYKGLENFLQGGGTL